MCGSTIDDWGDARSPIYGAFLFVFSFCALGTDDFLFLHVPSPPLTSRVINPPISILCFYLHTSSSRFVPSRSIFTVSTRTLSVSIHGLHACLHRGSGLRPSSAQLRNRSGGRAYEGSGGVQGDKVRRQYHCDCADRANSFCLCGLQAYALTRIELRTNFSSVSILHLRPRASSAPPSPSSCIIGSSISILALHRLLHIHPCASWSPSHILSISVRSLNIRARGYMVCQAAKGSESIGSAHGWRGMSSISLRTR